MRRRERLSPRELQVLQAFADGGTYDDVAREWCLSRETIRTYAKQARAKLRVHRTLDAVVLGMREGWLS